MIFGVSFIFLYLAIGANGLNNDLSCFQTLSSTLFVFSTPLQFLLTQSYKEGYLLIPLILAMNARFLLMSGTLAPYFAKVKLRSLFCSSILICPSVFIGSLAHFKKNKENLYGFAPTIHSPCRQTLSQLQRNCKLYVGFCFCSCVFVSLAQIFYLLILPFAIGLAILLLESRGQKK